MQLLGIFNFQPIWGGNAVSLGATFRSNQLGAATLFGRDATQVSDCALCHSVCLQMKTT